MPADMRTWIGQLEDAGELVRVRRPVDPRTEMGALLYQSREKALLFENLTGYPDVFQPWEVLWAINTRTNPETDVVVIPGVRAHPMDPTARELVPPGGPYWNRVGGKVLIDATKPPLCAAEEARKPFQRLRPMGWDRLRLEDFLRELGCTT
jgi:3-polyprenyl-4-hydroxybenzoate decarboxylase